MPSAVQYCSSVSARSSCLTKVPRSPALEMIVAPKPAVASTHVSKAALTVRIVPATGTLPRRITGSQRDNNPSSP